MAFHDVRRVRTAENLHLSENLAANGGIAVAVDDLESVDVGGALVADFVDCAAVAVPEDLEFFEVGGGDGRGRGGWEGEGEAGTAVGEVREAEF